METFTMEATTLSGNIYHGGHMVKWRLFNYLWLNEVQPRMRRSDDFGVDPLQREEGEDDGGRGHLVDDASHQLVVRGQHEVVHAKPGNIDDV